MEPVVRMVTPSQRRATPSRALHTSSIPRFDSLLSVHSTISDTFFDALEDVSSPVVYFLFVYFLFVYFLFTSCLFTVYFLFVYFLFVFKLNLLSVYIG